MESTPTNPLFVVLFFVLRCLVPITIMLGISYLLKKLGLISDSQKKPPEEDPHQHESDNGKGGFAHA